MSNHGSSIGQEPGLTWVPVVNYFGRGFQATYWRFVLPIVYLFLRQQAIEGKPNSDAASAAAWASSNSGMTGDKSVTEPVIVDFRQESEGPFGPNGIPHDIFVSSDPVYMRAPIERVKTRKELNPAVCREGVFQPQPRDVFQQFPASAVGRFYLKISEQYLWCSATQLGPNYILTAAHCVFDCDTGEEISGGTFFSQYYNAEYHEYGQIRSFAVWKDCEAGIPNYDFAIVKLWSNIKQSSYPTVASSTKVALSGSQDAFIYAYPAETQSGKVLVYSAVSPVTYSFVSESQVEMDISIERGSSGSGVYLRGIVAGLNNSQPAIVGITSYEYITDHCPNGFAAFQQGTYHPSVLVSKLGL